MSGKNSASVKEQARLRVLFDGWPLAYAPESPAALHLLELLSVLPGTIEARVVLPVTDLNWASARLPDQLDPRMALFWPAANTPTGRLRWEQHGLSSTARMQQASLIHSTRLYLPLFASCPVVVSPAEMVDASLVDEASGDAPLDNKTADPRGWLAGGIVGRIRSALGRGGLSAAQFVIWPEDLPVPDRKLPIRRLPAMVHEAYTTPLPRLSELPENYVLSAGALNDTGLRLLAAAWSWAISGLGDDWNLVVSGLDSSKQSRLRELCQETGAAETLRFSTLNLPLKRAAAFQSAAAVMLASPVTAWGDAYLQALACARPLAAQERPWEDARVGPAGYLTPASDARALGAAVLTMVVEEQVGEQLSEAARKRAAAWEKSEFSQRLLQIYAEAVPSAARVLLTAGQ